MTEDTSASKAAEDTSAADSQEAGREAVLAPLRAKHGEIAYWEIPRFGLVVAAAPENLAEHDRLLNTFKKPEADVAGALRTFATVCVVYPDAATVKQIFRKYPFFADKVAARGQELCGGEFEELGKD